MVFERRDRVEENLERSIFNFREIVAVLVDVFEQIGHGSVRNAVALYVGGVGRGVAPLPDDEFLPFAWFAGDK